MKTTKLLGMMTMALALLLQEAPAQADDAIFEASAGATVTTSTQEQPSEALVFGTVTLSEKGEVKVIWDGVTASLGSFTAGTAGQTSASREFYAAKLPTLYLDLQKLFGVKWMEKIRLSLAAGTYEDTPIGGHRDLNLGQIAINLTQTVLKTKAVQWTVDETAGMTGYFRREMYQPGQPFEAVPVNFAVNTKLVANISSSAVVTIAMGAYAMVFNGINASSGFEALVYGGQVSPSITFGKHWAVGGKLEGCEMIQLGSANAPQTALNVSGFVKYMIDSNHGRVHHSLEISVGSVDDGIVRDVNGNDTRATFAGLKYTVSF